MSFSRGENEEIKLDNSSFETTAPKRKKNSLQNSQLPYSIPDIQIHIPEDDTDTVYSETPSPNSETDADSRSQLQRDKMEKTNSGTSHQSIYYTTDISSNEQKSSFVSSITSLPDINNYMVIPNRDSSRNLPSKTNSAQSVSRSNLFENIIQEGDGVSRSNNYDKKYERKTSFSISEIPVDKQRRKSVADLASFMQPRKSIVELTPAMQARISVFETVQNQQIKSETENKTLDQAETIIERRKSILDEIPDMERRRSIRAEVLELERRYLSGDERSTDSLPDTRNEIQALQRRRSIRNEILSFEHRGSMQQKTTTPPRRYSREDNEDNLHYESIQSNDSEGNNEVFGPERDISIKRIIKEREQKESTKETDKRHVDEYQQGKQKDTTEIQSEPFTSDGEYSDTEEQYIRSVEPYLKYRKSISDLEPYFKHQSEAFKLSSSVQKEIARCEEITNDEGQKSKSGRESKSDFEMRWMIDETAPNLEYENSISDTMPFNHLHEYNFELGNPDTNLNERECQNENRYENMHYTDSRRSSRSSVTIRERRLSSEDSRPVEKVDGDQDIIRKRISEHQKSIAMEEMESIEQKLSKYPLNDSEINLTGAHSSDKSYDINYGRNNLSNRNSLSLGDVQLLSKKNSISGSLSSQSNSLQTLEMSTGQSLDYQTSDHDTDNSQRRKSIALEVLDFISRRLSKALDVSNENLTFAETDEQEFQQDYSSFPQDSISREETYQTQSGSISDIDNHRVSSGSISGKGIRSPPRLSISLEETKNSPPRSILQNSDKLDTEDIILYDQRRKSVTMDALNFMVRKFSSEPIPDHQSKISNDNPEHEEDIHKSVLDESSRRTSRSSVQSDHRLSRRSSTSLKDGNRLRRGSFTLESEQRSQRGSISSEYENKSQRNSFIDEEANKSQRGSISDSDYSIYHTEPILLDKGECSSKDTLTMNDGGPHKGSISNQGSQTSPRGSVSLQETQITYHESELQNDGKRSPRGSISRRSSYTSPQISKSIDECQRSLTGSVSSQDGQRSERNSLYEDQVKFQNRSLEGITPNDTQEVKYESLTDENYREERRESIGMDILGFIARRFSNVSENKDSNSVPSITVKEHMDSQAYESPHESRKSSKSSSENYHILSLDDQQRDSRYIDEGGSARKNSISTRDGHRSQRGSVSVEDGEISRKGSTVSNIGRRSSKGSIVHDGQGSQRGSISAEEGKGYYNEPLSMEEGQTSRRGSASADYAPLSQRDSFSLEARQMLPTGSASADDGRRSHEESLSLVDHKSYHRHSVPIEDESIRSKVAQDIRRSSRSSAQSNQRYSWGSVSQWESDNADEISRSRRSSASVEESYRSQRGSITIEEEQGSQRGSILSEYDRKPQRDSISYKDGNRSHRGSITVADDRSRKNSMAMEDGISRKGSRSDQVSQRSPRGSISLQETDTTYQGPGSPRGSISSEKSHSSYQVAKSIDEGQRSRSGSVSNQDRQISQRNSYYEEHAKSEDRPPEGTLANDYQDEKYDNLEYNTYEKQRRMSSGRDILGFITRRFSSVSENEQINSIPSITIEEHKDSQAYEPPQDNRRSSSSSSKNCHRSSIDDHQRSQTDSKLIDEEAISSRKNSIIGRDGNRSQRGSVSSEDDHILYRGSTVSDNGKRFSKGLIKYEGQGSPRGSISADKSKGYFNDSLSMEESQTSRRGSASADYGQQSQRDSLSQEASQRSHRGSVSGDDGQGSRKGSISLIDHRSHHRKSLPVDEETYRSISNQDDRRSSTSSNRGNHISPRGSIYPQDPQSLYQGPELFNDGKRSPRGSIPSENSQKSGQIPESIDESQKSRSGSFSKKVSQRDSLYGDQVEFQDRSSQGIAPRDTQDEKNYSLKDETSGEQRRKSIGMDILGFIARRFSNTSDTELNNSIPSITVKEHNDSQAYESPLGSRKSSISSSQNYHRSSIDNQQWSQGDATFPDEEAVSSRRSSISNRDGQRSQRGSLLAEDSNLSRKGSTVSDNGKRSSKGLIIYHGQGSPRGSISADKSKGYFNDSLSMEESQTSRRGSASADYGRQSQRESFSLEPSQMSQDDMYEKYAYPEEANHSSKTYAKDYNVSQFIAKSDSEPNDTFEKYKMYGNVPNETPDVVLHHYIQRSFSEETPDIIDYGSDSESGSELNFDLALTEIESGIQSTIVVNGNEANKYKIRGDQSEIIFTNTHKDEGVTPDLYEALYGHIITLLTLPELGGVEHELCATFIPDVTLESSINDTEWIKISHKNKNFTGSPTSSLIPMSSSSILDKKGGWTTVDALQDQKKRKTLDSISTVTFCGCGFLGGYLVGAATYLQERAPHVLHGRLAGSSVGSLIATCLACDVPLEYVRKNILATADVAQKYFMGPFNPFFPLEEPLLKNLLQLIPEDGHIRASGRLFLSLTRATTLTNEIVSEYSSRDELVRAILCCCFLPFISGFTVPSFNGRKYIDGGMSNNMPLKGPNTLTINAFSGEFDICPEDPDGPVRPLATAFNQNIQMTNNNLTRLIHALLPPSSEMLDKHFQQGYSDAKKYFSL